MSAAWGHITAGEIEKAVSGRRIAGPGEAAIAGLCTDTRRLGPGDLFWALQGERFDGHDFLSQAFDLGAAGVVADSARLSGQPVPEGRVAIAVQDTLKALGDLASWWRHAHRVFIAALTGSAGKTTTKEMAAAVFEEDGPTLRSEGNFNNLIGLPLTLVRLRSEHRRAVLEMGMNRPGEIARLTEIADPDVGLITNVARAHLEGLGDIRAVARAKAELLDGMSRDRTAVLNGDDPLLMAEAHRFRGRVLTFGLGVKNDFRAEGIRERGREGLDFVLLHEGEAVPVHLSAPGRQNVMNGLAAAAMAVAAGRPLSVVARGLATFRGIPGRFTVVDLPGGALLVDDTYNANPSSLKAALDSMGSLARRGGCIIAGLGDMLELGRETASAHLEAGRMAADRGVAHLFVLGDQADLVIRGALEHGLSGQCVHRMRNHEEMADGIQAVLSEKDVILLKASRGMRLERVAERLREAKEKGGRHGLDQEGPGGG